MENQVNFKKPRTRAQLNRALMAGSAVMLTGGLLTGSAIGQGPSGTQSFRNASGILRTVPTNGFIDRSGPFFQPLGKAFPITCEHCHFAGEAWGISSAHAQQLFNSTNGMHPLFTAGTASDFLAAQVPGNVDTLAKRQTQYNLMLSKGLALVRRNFAPTTAEFDIVGVKPPAGFAAGQSPTMIAAPDGSGDLIVDGAWYLNYTASSNAGTPQIWVYRRPLPTTNFRFLTAVGWDGQDTRQAPDPLRRPTSAGSFDVARSTIRGRETGPTLIAPDNHAYTNPELDTLATQLNEFMFSTITAQDFDNGAGALNANGANGGVFNLINTVNYFGINDVLEGDLMVVPGAAPNTVKEVFSGAPFNPNVFVQYSAWNGNSNTARASIARGQVLFNQTNRFIIDDVNGIQANNRIINGIVENPAPITGATLTFPDSRVANGLTGVVPGSIAGCVTCHDSPNIGNHSTRLPINIGVADIKPAGSNNNANPNLNNSNLPVFYLRNKLTNTLVLTTDPGRAIISGRWAHIAQFKGPILRGLVNRAPFFHSGMAKNLEAVIEFYDKRFQANFTTQEKVDLVAFLKTL